MAKQVQQRVTFRVIGIVAVVYTRSAGYNGFYTFRNVWWKTPCQGLGTRLVYFLDLVEVIESIDLSLLSIQIQSFRFYLKSRILVEFRNSSPELGRGSLRPQGQWWNMVIGQNMGVNFYSEYKIYLHQAWFYSTIFDVLLFVVQAPLIQVIQKLLIFFPMIVPHLLDQQSQAMQQYATMQYCHQQQENMDT